MTSFNRRIFAFVVISALSSACAPEPWPEPPPVSEEEFAASHAEWHAYRESRQTVPPSGPVIWIGLWELREGANTVGAGDEVSILLAANDVPELAGTIRMEDGAITLEPNEGFASEDGTPVETVMELAHDRSENPTLLRLGSLGMRIHSERGTERLWLRVWDEEHPQIGSFTLPPYYPVTQDWRVTARFEPYPEPRIFELDDVTDGQVENESPGELAFRAAGREHRLVAFASPTSSSFFVSLWDSTAVVNTYQGGRYLRVPFADSTGFTTIDFNRTYNPPCVFTQFSVCSLPPRENRLALAVTAGEQRPTDSTY